MSSCHGKTLGKPMIATLAECSEACDQMIHHEVCIGFQFYHMGGREDSGGEGFGVSMVQPLCIFLKEVKDVVTYDCDFVNDLTKQYEEETKEEKEKLLFLQNKTSSFLQQHEPEKDDEDDAPKKLAEAHCDSVKTQLLYTGMTCDELYGPDSSIKKTCKKFCERTSGAMLSSTCFL